MQRQIINIDEDLCNGCGDCVPSCAEGAIQIIDGKAKLVKDALCDGLGACLGDCPEGALTIETRDAAEFDEELVEEHLTKLDRVEAPAAAPAPPPMAAMQAGGGGLHAHGGGMGGCPGSRAMSFDEPGAASDSGGEEGTRPSQLRQWPVQLHLVSPTAPYFQGADVLLCADCVPFAMGDFHKDFLKDRALAIACPKLDQGQEMYLQKLVSMIDDAKIDTLTVMIMQVPCCGGLLHLATEAAARASRKVPVKKIVIGLQGEVLAEEWA
jgi:NAD-dependent dihydropyrimidine dehydrogenase PreA subunit